MIELTIEEVQQLGEAEAGALSTIIRNYSDLTPEEITQAYNDQVRAEMEIHCSVLREALLTLGLWSESHQTEVTDPLSMAVFAKKLAIHMVLTSVRMFEMQKMTDGMNAQMKLQTSVFMDRMGSMSEADGNRVTGNLVSMPWDLSGASDPEAVLSGLWKNLDYPEAILDNPAAIFFTDGESDSLEEAAISLKAAIQALSDKILSCQIADQSVRIDKMVQLIKDGLKDIE